MTECRVGDLVLWYPPTKDGGSIKREHGQVVAVCRLPEGTILGVNRRGRCFNVPMDDVRLVARTHVELDDLLHSEEYRKRSPEERRIAAHWDELLGAHGRGGKDQA